jgi:hypothetical protein
MDTWIKFDARCEVYEKKTDRKPEAGTRLYREVGEWLAYRFWIRELARWFEGDLIPLEWVAQFVGVTRAAVHRRVANGDLTVFAFTFEEEVKSLLGGRRKRMKAEYRYAVLTECEQWFSLHRSTAIENEEIKMKMKRLRKDFK